MKIDELNKTALRAALSKAADLGWCFEQAPRHRADLAKIIMACLAALPAEPEIEDGVRVRICVAMSEDGTWTSAGHHDWDDEKTRTEAKWTDENAQIRWIEATIPPYAQPAEPVVEGRVGG